MNPGDRVVWHTFKRNENYDFITHDAIIVSVGEGWRFVEIDYLDYDGLFAQKVRRTVPGDRLIGRDRFVRGLDDEVETVNED